MITVEHLAGTDQLQGQQSQPSHGQQSMQPVSPGPQSKHDPPVPLFGMAQSQGMQQSQ